LAQRAEETYNLLTVEQQQLARRALLRLTQPGEGTEDTRRRALKSELAPANAGEDFEEVLDRLVDARLLTTGRDEAGVEIVDVSHEALVRGWPRLRAWIDADRQDLVVHRRLTDTASEWARLGRDTSVQYRGARLAAADEWATGHADDLNQLERDFLAASQAADKRRTRLRALTTALAVLSVIVAVLAVWALGQRSDAQRQRSIARAQARETTSLALTLSASPLLKKRPDLALMLAFEGYHTSRRAEARGGVLAGLVATRDPGIVAILHGQTSAVYAVAFGPGGRTLASAGGDTKVRLWDVRTHKQLGRPLTGHSGPINGLAFSPDGRMLASAGGDTKVRLWDVRTHKQLGRSLTGHTYAVHGWWSDRTPIPP
jgi:hypothetical protein